MNRIDERFARLKASGRKALIGYITAGFPTRASLSQLVPLLEKAGADILEIGVPFSDPMADGPTIQAASQKALENGVTLAWILSQVSALRAKGVTLPLLLMSYCNPIQAMGVETFFRRAKAAGVDGLILPDMIPEESGPYSRAARMAGIHLVYLVAPTSPAARVTQIAKATGGFLYAVSLTGVTGVSHAVAKEVDQFLKVIRRCCTKPIAVGFGITTPEQAVALSTHADGVIVGSALIRQIEKSTNASFLPAVQFIASIRRALDTGKRKGASHAS